MREPQAKASCRKDYAPPAFRIETVELDVEIREDDALVTSRLKTVRRTVPQKNTQLEGLYATKNGFVTQCEAQGFRRITWFIDRPDIMARYTTTVRADAAKCPVLLSNGNLVASGKGWA